ncbi:MAG TPA: glycosyl hydrolase family 65 protein [Stellaceae bacterium]|nr:glycosyl hydrolase family 65 protein [Stellaceae bacterium]
MAGPAFEISFTRYDPADERRREALLALGNGWLLVRGCAAGAAADGRHYPGTYRAGCYDRAFSEVDGERFAIETLVNLPNWLPLGFRIEGDGEWFSLDRVTILDYRHSLDLAQGVARREVRFAAGGRRTWVREERLVAMAEPQLAALRLEIRPEDWGGEIEIRSALDGHVKNANVRRYLRFPHRHLTDASGRAVEPGLMIVSTRTRQSAIEIAVAARTRLDGTEGTWRQVEQAGATVAQGATLAVAPGQTIGVEKLAAIVTARDPAASAPAETALRAVREAPSYAALRAAHAERWASLWQRGAIEIARRDVAEAIALHRFHLLQTISPHSAGLDVGFPPHGWQEGYLGQVFWDDVLVLPYLAAAFPSVARALLLYRWRRLGEARRAARREGCRGAMFPWRSASTGEEVTPAFQLNLLSGRWMRDDTRRQRHVGAAIAYGLWQYFTATGDCDFIEEYGAELLFEIARFWASIAHCNPDDGRYDIRGVIGPDEFHDAYPGAGEPGIDNNAYTNVMAAWTLCRALELRDRLRPACRDRLCRLLAIDAAEWALWDKVSRRLRVPFHDDGVISQFEGYDRLAPLDLGRLAKTHPGERADWALEAQGDDVCRYQVAKQADVLMLFYLLPGDALARMFARLGYAVDDDQLRRTAAYYLARTTHDSSLSRVAHAGALARIAPAQSWRFFRDALRVDEEPCNSATSDEGLHLGAMAGSIDVLQRHYLGLRLDPDAISLDPALPADLGPVALEFQWRGDRFRLHWAGSRLCLDAEPGNRSTAAVHRGGRSELLPPGKTLSLTDPA